MDRFTLLSSTTSMRAPVTSSGAVRRLARSSACGSSTLNEKVAPRPSTLSALISPPIRATSREVIASPSPVPSWRRVDEASTWLNFSNTWSSLSAGMPMPVSLTTIVSRVLALTADAADVDQHMAGVGELDRVAEQVGDDLPNATDVPDIVLVRASVPTRTISSRSFSLARAEISVATSSIASAG